MVKAPDIMKIQITTPHNGSRTCAIIGQHLGRKPVWTLFIHLLWATMLVLPATIGAQSCAVLTNLYSFTGGNDGGWPVTGLVQGSDGNFYGTTYEGGTHGCGTVFKISANGALTTLYSFTGGNDGAISRCRAGAGQRRQFLWHDCTAAARTAMAPCSKSAPMGR